MDHLLFQANASPETRGAAWTRNASIVNLFNRLKNGISGGWQPDGPGFGPYGAVRWYNRWSTGANPGLAILWQPIIEDLLK